MCFEKMLRGISEMVSARAPKLWHCVSAPPDNLLVGMSGALETKKTLSKLEHFFPENKVKYLRNGEG